MCLGAKGGDSVDGRKLRMGCSILSTLYSSASSFARSNGIHVPGDLVSTEKGQLGEELTLIFSIASLNLFMPSSLHLPLKNSSSGRLVKVGNLQDLCRIQPGIRPPTHTGDAICDIFVDRNAAVGRLEYLGRKWVPHCRRVFR